MSAIYNFLNSFGISTLMLWTVHDELHLSGYDERLSTYRKSLTIISIILTHQKVTASCLIITCVKLYGNPS